MNVDFFKQELNHMSINTFGGLMMLSMFVASMLTLMGARAYARYQSRRAREEQVRWRIHEISDTQSQVHKQPTAPDPTPEAYVWR